MNTIIITLTSTTVRYAAIDIVMLIATLRASDRQVYVLQSRKEPISIHLN